MAGKDRSDAQAKADARLLDELIAAAEVEPQVDRFNSDHALTDGLVELLERRSVRDTLMRLADELLPIEAEPKDPERPDAERQDIVAAVDPTARCSWADPLSHGYVWWNVIGLPRADYLRKRVRLLALLRALRDRLPAAVRIPRPEDVPAELRVSFAEAVAGVPNLGLPETPRSTLYTRMRNELTAKLLGVRPSASPTAQRPLVAGLLALQERAKSSGRRPPQARSREHGA